MNDQVLLVLDASNFARKGRKSDLRRFFAVFSAVTTALDGRNHYLHIVEDHDFKTFFSKSERKSLTKWLKSQNSVVAGTGDRTSGVKADDVVLAWARERPGSIVLSSDGFQDYDEHKEWLYQPGRFVAGSYTEFDGTWTLVERSMPLRVGGKIKGPRRPFSVLLDDLFPTPRSICRQSGVELEHCAFLLDELNLGNRDTVILNQDIANEFREAAEKLREASLPLQQISSQYGVTEKALAEMCRIVGIKTSEIGKRKFLKDADRPAIDELLQSPFNTPDRCKLKIAIHQKNIRKIQSCKKSLDALGDHDALTVIQIWEELLSNNSEISWSLIENVSPALHTDIFSYLIQTNELERLNSIPPQLKKKLAPQLRLLQACLSFSHEKKYAHLDEFFKDLKNVVSRNPSIIDVLTASDIWRQVESTISDIDLFSQLRFTKNQHKTLAKNWAEYFSSSPALITLNFVNGDFRLFFSPGKRSKSNQLKKLRRHYLDNHIEAAWIPVEEFEALLREEGTISQLQENNFAALMSHPLVVTATRANIETVSNLNSPISQLALSYVITSTLTAIDVQMRKPIDELTYLLQPFKEPS